MSKNGTKPNGGPGNGGSRSSQGMRKSPWPDPWSAEWKGETVAEPTVWVLADDRAGNVSQAVGVAEALAWPFEQKAIRYTAFGALPNALRGASLRGVNPDSRADLTPPWPDVVISAGRRTAPIARWIKHQSGGHSYLCHVMWPGSSGIGDFDLVAVPTHDQLSGSRESVVRITGAPHRVSEGKLAIEGTKWNNRFAALKRPFLALVVGGSTKSTDFTAAMASELGRQASVLAEQMGATILVTTSRRTGEAQTQALMQALPTPGYSYLWHPDGKPQDNPYFGFLALADAVVVTGDSVSMVSEACASAASVYVYAPKGLTTPKHDRLLNHLYGLGMAEPLGRHPFSRWDRPRLNAAQEVAALIHRAMIRRLHVAPDSHDGN
jgi:mitochondrial fission protein ELM1